MPDVSTREHLIEVGFKLMQQFSYSATGLSEVLALAGLSKGSFYHYFSSKEDFGIAIAKRYLDQEAKRASTMLRISRTSPIKRLRKYFEELIQIYGPKGARGGGCLLGNLSQEMANQSDLMQKTLQQGFKVWEAAVSATLQEAAARGELSPKVNTTEMASFILNSYEGALLRAKADRSDAPLHLFLQMTFGRYLIAG